MAELSTTVKVEFTAPEQDETFELVADDNDQGGSAPVQIAYQRVSDYLVAQWGRVELTPTADPITPLDVVEPGKKRLKLYCSEQVEPTVCLFAEGCEIVNLGRRAEGVTEALTWNKNQSKKLRFSYDQPGVTILEQTTFRDAIGNIVPPPTYDRATGSFTAVAEVMGALVVQYETSFSLYEVRYGNGSEVATPPHFSEMQKAWQSGDVETTEIPPVRVLALSDWHAAITSFPRKFWPKGAPKLKFRFWTNKGLNDGNDAESPNAEEEESEEINGFYQEMPGTRQTVTERVYHPDDPNQYIEVKKTLYLEARNTRTGDTFKLRLLNGT
uniref:Uncharacterized protein n=1 Tax=Magnetococcus massalia (strain MO-1) TaxID=451514 RepID=A0A1S7LJI8_MAGMO|nr:Conserved protein of unknown function [Candidatus Magnetococcus massalia]